MKSNVQFLFNQLLLLTGFICSVAKKETKLEKSGGPKILIYITSHMSINHKGHLKHCWPLALQNSHLLNSSDVKVYMTPEKDDIDESVQLIKDTFKNQNLTYYVTSNEGYQDGAIAAMKEGSKKGFFDGYEWVVRLNPDVIIQNDAWFLDTMINDKNAALLYVNCLPPGTEPYRNLYPTDPITKKAILIHTDFFAFKPGALPKGQLETRNWLGAEGTISHQMTPLIENNQHRHVSKTWPRHHKHCRVDGNRHGPVFHYHSGFISLRRRLKMSLCPAEFF